MDLDCTMQKRVHNLPFDIISDLPLNILETILIRLPLRDAVRTSVLSRKWRYNWIRIPNLVFDDTLFPELKEPIMYMTTISHVLSCHRGPILNFTLFVPHIKVCSGIDQLINFLPKEYVREFSLWIGRMTFDAPECYKLPSSFFSCLQLTDLDLFQCVFDPPPGFDGFSRLRRLDLKLVDIEDDTLNNLISKCPLLQILHLHSVGRLEIDAPVLKSLYIHQSFDFIRFKNTPLLAILSVPPCDFPYGVGNSSNMIEVFCSIPLIEEVDMGHDLMFLCCGGDDVPERLPIILNQLTTLVFDTVQFDEMELEDEYEEEIVDEESVVELLEVQYDLDICFSRLREVQISLLSGTMSEFKFITLILAKSPVLEKMVLQPSKARSKKRFNNMYRKVTSFKSLSPNARIILMNSDGN